MSGRYFVVKVGDAMGPSGSGGVTRMAVCTDCGSVLWSATVTCNETTGWRDVVEHPVHDALHTRLEAA